MSNNKTNASDFVDSPGANASDITATTLDRKRGFDVSLISGNGPLSGVPWVAHSKVVASNIVTYTFYSDVAKTVLLKTATLTYLDDTLCDLTGSVWT